MHLLYLFKKAPFRRIRATFPQRGQVFGGQRVKYPAPSWGRMSAGQKEDFQREAIHFSPDSYEYPFQISKKNLVNQSITLLYTHGRKSITDTLLSKVYFHVKPPIADIQRLSVSIRHIEASFSCENGRSGSYRSGGSPILRRRYNETIL
jgi:hypothetical protein